MELLESDEATEKEEEIEAEADETGAEADESVSEIGALDKEEEDDGTGNGYPHISKLFCRRSSSSWGVTPPPPPELATLTVSGPALPGGDVRPPFFAKTL